MPISIIPAPSGGGSTPTLAQVLAQGADGGTVDQSNLGSLTQAGSKFMQTSYVTLNDIGDGSAANNSIYVAADILTFRDRNGIVHPVQLA